MDPTKPYYTCFFTNKGLTINMCEDLICKKPLPVKKITIYTYTYVELNSSSSSSTGYQYLKGTSFFLHPLSDS